MRIKSVFVCPVCGSEVTELQDNWDVCTACPDIAEIFGGVVRSYIAAASWTESGDPGLPPTDDFENHAYEDCGEFLERALELRLLDQRTVCSDGLGVDFWLTRNRHGAGFWDKPALYGTEHATGLTELALSFGEVYACADNDQIDLM